MPRTDQYFRYLLATGLRENIALQKAIFVDPAEEPTIRARATERLNMDATDRGIVSFEAARAFGMIGWDGLSAGAPLTSANELLKRIGRPLVPDTTIYSV